MNSNQDICDMKEDIMNTVTRVIAEVIIFDNCLKMTFNYS